MTWDEIHSWGREMIQMINVFAMQAGWAEFTYLEPWENMDVMMYVSNTSTPEVNWEEEAEKTPQHWKARQPKQWSDGDSWRSPFVFQSFCSENMWLYGHRMTFLSYKKALFSFHLQISASGRAAFWLHNEFPVPDSSWHTTGAICSLGDFK